MEGVEDDPRFSHIASDPRFKPMPKSKKKVKIDNRFQSLFTSKHFTHRTDMDKRGRPVRDSKKKSKHTMERFYEMSDSESDDSGSGDDDDDDDDNETVNTTKLANKAKKSENNDHVVVKKVKPLDEDSEKEESDSSEEEDESEEEELPEYTEKFDLPETEVDHKWNEHQNEASRVSESTKRLALCNMDWDFVKAQDLFILFKSFVPEGGCLNSVAIYPSEFGKERMTEEAMLGPKEMRDKLQNGKSVEEDDKKKKKGKKLDEKKEKRKKKESNEVHREKLREYQLNRLKYYYAVVDCDSVRTADAIYSECDGREYQLSSVQLDLRFIPDDMTFEDEPREMFTDGQTTVDYQPNIFQSSALSQAKVEVTWDETEFDRLSRRVSALQQKELESIVEENKYSDIIAPPESDSEEEKDRPEWLKNVLAQEDNDSDEDEEENDKKSISEEKKIKLYRQLLMDKIAEEEEDKQKEENDVDKVMEWQPGLKTSVEKKLKKKEKKKEDSAVVGEYLEKKKEKKKKKRDKKKQELAPQDGEEAFSDDDIPEDMEIDDSLKEMMKGEEVNFADKGKKKKKKKKFDDTEVNEEDEREKAELELILMQDGESKKLAKPEIVDESGSKKRKSKKQMAKLKKAGQKESEDFVLDVEDNRFSALFTSHLFHIDPTAPQFKKTKNMVRLVDEQIKRKNKPKSGKKRGHEGSEGAQVEESVKTPSSSKSVSQSLVESLKKKMKKS